MLKLLGEVVRFGLAGLANTAVGLGVTVALDLGLHVAPYLANAAGYAVGMVLSYVLNRLFVFRSAKGAKLSAPKFAVTLAIAFAVNQLVLFAMGHVLGNAPTMRLAAQIVAMATYTAINFTLCRFWVFADRRSALGTRPA